MNISRKPTLKIPRIILPPSSLFFLFILLSLLLTACGAPEPEPAPTPEPRIIAAIGDSLVSGGKKAFPEGHMSTIRGGWVTRLQFLLDEDYPGQYQTINLGKSDAYALGVQSQLPAVIEQNPAFIIIQVGGDDFNGLYSEDTFKTTLENFMLTIEQIIIQIQEESPETNICFVGYPPPLKKYADQSNSMYTFDVQEVMDERFKIFNDALGDIAEEYSVTFIDIISHMPEDVEERWALSMDGIRPNDAGYELLTELIYDAILDFLESK